MSAPNPDTVIQELARQLGEAERVLFITGAGMSADSGLPTYRGIGGLYDEQLTEDDIPIEQAMSGPMFKQNPQLTWKYLLQLGSACADKRYNRGHEILTALETVNPGVWVLTQNVDGYHRAAGSRNVIEIHGRIQDLYCPACNHQTHWETSVPLREAPLCPQCGAYLRPNVVLFEESLNPLHLTTFYQQLALGFDMVFSIGTSSVFPYITMPVLTARHRGKPTIEINPQQTQISNLVEYRLPLTAVDALERLWQAL